jgi:hypothetical protein
MSAIAAVAQTARSSRPLSQREQRLESLGGFLLAGRADLGACEHADGEGEEDEDEREIAGGCRDRAGAEPRDLLLNALRDVCGRDALRHGAEDVRKHGNADRPSDQHSALAAQCLGGGR